MDEMRGFFGASHDCRIKMAPRKERSGVEAKPRSYEDFLTTDRHSARPGRDRANESHHRATGTISLVRNLSGIEPNFSWALSADTLCTRTYSTLSGQAWELMSTKTIRVDRCCAAMW